MQKTENKFIAPLPWETSTDRDINFERTYSRKYYDYAIRWVGNEVAAHKSLKNGKAYRVPYLKLKSLIAQAGMFWHRTQRNSLFEVTAFYHHHLHSTCQILSNSILDSFFANE